MINTRFNRKENNKNYADTVVFKEKSMVALSLYLAMFIAIVGSVTYYVVESPVRAKLQENLDLRTELLSALITEPLNSSEGFVDSLVGLAQAQRSGAEVLPLFKSMLAASDNTIVSAGIWPEPYMFNPQMQLNSYFSIKQTMARLTSCSLITILRLHLIIKSIGIPPSLTEARNHFVERCLYRSIHPCSNDHRFIPLLL